MLDRYQATLLAVAVGDALGQSVETMSPEEILRATDGKGVQGFLDPLQSTFPSTRNLRAGDTTDDYQLTRAVAEAILTARGFDLTEQARSHVRAHDEQAAGWGGTTERAVLRLKEWFESGGERGRDPRSGAESERPGHGAGNGVAMKIAPLALLNVGGSDWVLLCETKDLARMTHDHPDALWCAYAHALVLTRVLTRDEELTAEEGGDLLEDVMLDLEDVGEDGAKETIEQLRRVKERLGDTERLRKEITPDFSAITSVPYAIGMALTRPQDFRGTVLACVNAGGDSDSTASMAGSIVAANTGLKSIPVEWATYNRKFGDAVELGARLHELAREDQERWKQKRDE